MGIKLEYLLVLAVSVIIFMTTTIKLTSAVSKNNIIDKELEFINTTFIEVDTKTMLAKLYSPHGIRKDEALHLSNVNYSTPNIESLLANKASYSQNILHLDGNIILNESSGNVYKTEHAMYHQENQILMVTAPFVAYMDKNIFRGNALWYNAVTKEMNATQIDAIVYTTEK